MARIWVWAACLGVASLGGPWAPAVSAQVPIPPTGPLVFCVSPPTAPVEPGAPVAICVKYPGPGAAVDVVLLTAESTLTPAERAGLPATIALTSGSPSVAGEDGVLLFESKAPDVPAASYRIRARQTSNCGPAPCRETADDFRLAIKAKLSLSRSEAAVGSTVTVTGKGLAPSAQVRLAFGTERPTLTPSGTNALGTIEASFTVPEVSLGPHVLKLSGPSCAVASRCASAQVTVTPAATTTTTSTTWPSTTTTTSSTTTSSTTISAPSGDGDGDGNGTAIIVAVISSVAVIVAAVISGLLARGRSARQDRAGGTG